MDKKFTPLIALAALMVIAAFAVWYIKNKAATVAAAPVAPVVDDSVDDTYGCAQATSVRNGFVTLQACMDQRKSAAAAQAVADQQQADRDAAAAKKKRNTQWGLGILTGGIGNALGWS